MGEICLHVNSSLNKSSLIYTKFTGYNLAYVVVLNGTKSLYI